MRDVKQQAVVLAARDIVKAQAAKARAEREKKDKETARIVRYVCNSRFSCATDRCFRDVFTFGLGEAGDWGGLKSAIEAQEAIIRAAEGKRHDPCRNIYID